jgi:hypothetical protein
MCEGCWPVEGFSNLAPPAPKGSGPIIKPPQNHQLAPSPRTLVVNDRSLTSVALVM